MTTVTDKKVSDDPGGPMVGVCAGARCAALWRLRDAACPPGIDAFDTDRVQSVRRAIAATPGGALTRLDCIGVCAQAPVVGVAHRRPDTATTGQVTWLVGADAPDRHAALLSWLRADWTAGPAAPPDALRAALFRMARVHDRAQ